MNNKHNNITPLPTALSGNAMLPQSQIGIITQVSHDELYQIDNTPISCAKQALSCLVKPQLGDKVIYWQLNDEKWVLAVLENTHTAPASDASARSISLPNQQAINIEADKLSVTARKRIALSSLEDIQINAAMGKLSISAARCYQSIRESLVQMSKQFIQRGEYVDQQASKLMKSHAGHHVMTADHDIKVDADRINMG